MTLNPINWSWIIIFAAVALAVVVAFAAWVIALPWIVQPFLRMALKVRYDLMILGRDNVPKTGPVLLVSNHVTWFDGFFLAASIPRRGTALVNAGVFGLPIVGYLAKRCGLLSIPYTGPKAQRAAIGTARTALDEGRLLGIFPEGQLTRNGFTGAFHRGLEVILNGREQIPVVPVFVGNVWGSLLSYSGGRCLWKKPQGWRRQVIIAFGPPIPPPIDVFKVRQAILVQGVNASGAEPRASSKVEGDPALPSWRHTSLGLLAASMPDDDEGGAKQVGHKPGTVGHAIPGVALRAVANDGEILGPNLVGNLETLLPDRPEWAKTDRRGQIDRDGFVTLEGDKP